MQHRYVPKPTWKCWYAISYYDFNWNEIEPLAKSGLDAFGVTGAVYEFTQLWNRLERGQAVQLPDDRVPIAFTIEVYHVEGEKEREVERKRLCAGYPEGRDCRAPRRSGRTDDVSEPNAVHDASVGQPDVDAPGRQVDDTSGGGALAGSAGHADRDYHGSDCLFVAHDRACRPQSGHPRQTDSLGARMEPDEKKIANG